METTFQETRDHLGVETQRQWSDLAIARSNSFSAIMANNMPRLLRRTNHGDAGWNQSAHFDALAGRQDW
jgi:hypothetical protein